jgi:RimJ/RimL family protein N-acetyltransferase
VYPTKGGILTNMLEKDNYFWQGEKVRLRQVSPNDWMEWFDDFEDSDAIRLLECGVELPKTEEMAQMLYSQWSNFNTTAYKMMFSVETINGELVGGASLNPYDQKNGCFSFEIRINRDHRGKGYGSDALRILLRYAFYELRYQKCNSECIHINEAGIKIHKKFGFIDEGRERRSVYTNAQYYDQVLLGLTREEFDESEKEYLRSK